MSQLANPHHGRSADSPGAVRSSSPCKSDHLALPPRVDTTRLPTSIIPSKNSRVCPNPTTASLLQCAWFGNQDPPYQLSHRFALDYSSVIGAPTNESAVGWCLRHSFEAALNRNANQRHNARKKQGFRQFLSASVGAKSQISIFQNIFRKYFFRIFSLELFSGYTLHPTPWYRV